MPKSQLFIIGGVLAVVIIAVFIFIGVLPGRRNPNPEPVTITFWGVEDDESSYRAVLADFQKDYPQITVNYKKIAEGSYEKTLLNALAENAGPDIFMLHNSWTLKDAGKIRPLSEVAEFQAKDFQNTFVPVAQNDLLEKDGKILGLPLYVDSLALFYNQDMFAAAGIAQAPKTWDDALLFSQKLTSLTANSDIIKSGATLGTYANIDRAFEILSALILQSGDPIVNKNERRAKLDRGAAEALAFYTSFADPQKPQYTWNDRMRTAFSAFGEETAAMTFGYLSDKARIEARNAHLSLRVSPLPQLKSGSNPITLGSYYFPTVSRASLHPLESWQFLLFLTAKEHAKQYLAATGKIPARFDLIDENGANQTQEVFYRQALYAKTWQIPDDRIARNLFADAINSLVSRTGNATDAIFRLQEQLNLLMP